MSPAKSILFITSMPASRSNAIGVQTLHFAEAFSPRWRHCYWDNGMGKSESPNSYRLNSPIPSLWPFALGRGFLTRGVEQFGLGWWRDNRLNERGKGHLRELMAGTGVAYVAPLRCSEVTKCREIIETIDCPFVAHIWDLMDSSLNADYKWLLSRAEHVFCLSATMTGLLRENGARDVSLLGFVRPRSAYRARHMSNTQLVIGLVGFLVAYQEGLRLLDDAVAELRTEFCDIRLKYIGPPGQLEFMPERLRGITEDIGFADDESRDKALADCNVGYLPGPMLPPQQDARSRHSVPSRSADYMANGLPIIAAAHPLSATSIFFSPIHGRGFYLASEPKDVGRALDILRSERVWAQAASECLAFFEKHCEKEIGQSRLRSVAGRFL